MGRGTYSDTISGYIKAFDPVENAYIIHTRSKENIKVYLKENTVAQLLRNIGEPYQDCTANMKEMLTPERFLITYAIFYPKEHRYFAEAQFIVFMGKEVGEYRFEQKDWWIQQIEALLLFYKRAQFGEQPIDFKNYRTSLYLSGAKIENNNLQESITLSRFIYSFSTAYLLTGKDEYLDISQKGCNYLQEHMRFFDKKHDVICWYHGVEIRDNQMHKIFASKHNEDRDTIAIYEQIYSLTGIVQTYRITGEPSLLEDCNKTLNFFDKYFLDRKYGGYFSHVDPNTFSPYSETLGINRAKKNWNSIGDHESAYLISLWVATRDSKYKKMLEDNTDLIAKYFPDFPQSVFVQERFHEDWSADKSYAWQQDRAVIGHNLKILWSLMRGYNLFQKEEYKSITTKMANLLYHYGLDERRGGWYDVMERQLKDRETKHRFSFHDRKIWWQQEQGILAYLILSEVSKNKNYLALARETAAFYNTFFLDHQDGGVYFTVLADGHPYLQGDERLKGSHAMSAYHAFELPFMAHIYTNLFVLNQDIMLYYRPLPNNSFNKKLYVAPDIFPNNMVILSKVWIDGKPYEKFDPKEMLVHLPESNHALNVRVKISRYR